MFNHDDIFKNYVNGKYTKQNMSIKEKCIILKVDLKRDLTYATMGAPFCKSTYTYSKWKYMEYNDYTLKPTLFKVVSQVAQAY